MGAIIGGVIGGLVGLALIVALICLVVYFVRRSKAKKYFENRSHNEIKSKVEEPVESLKIAETENLSYIEVVKVNASPSVNKLSRSQRVIMSIEQVKKDEPTYSEVKKNFNDALGQRNNLDNYTVLSPGKLKDLVVKYN